MKNIEYDIPIFESNDLADLDLYSEKMAAAIKGQIDKFGNPLAFKGIKQNISELDLISNPQSGDIYGVIETNKNYIWNGKEWIIYSDIMELDNYYNKEEINQKIADIQALPTGGTKGQVLTKQSETNGDANWEDIEANEVFVGNEEEAPDTAKIIIEDEDLEESSGLSKAEVYVGVEEPTTGEKVWFRKSGKNKFNGILSLGSIHAENGTENNNSTTAIRSNFIEVDSNTVYTLSSVDKYNHFIVYYDKVYKYINYFAKEKSINTFTTPENCKYIRFTTYMALEVTDTTTKFQLEQNTKATTYEDYREPQIRIRNSDGVYEKFM